MDEVLFDQELEVFRARERCIMRPCAEDEVEEWEIGDSSIAMSFPYLME